MASDEELQVIVHDAVSNAFTVQLIANLSYQVDDAFKRPTMINDFGRKCSIYLYDDYSIC
jgi:methionine synthase II (cobalamin-independent)